MKKSAAVSAMIIMLCMAGCNSDTQTSSVVPSTSDSVSAAESTSASAEQSGSESSSADSGVHSDNAGNSADNTTQQSSPETSVSIESEESTKSVTAESELDIPPQTTAEEVIDPVIISEPFTRDTRISDVISDPVFGDYGRLIFPVDEGYYSGETLGDLRLTWYNNIDPDKTVEIASYMRSLAASGDVIFYDIYSESEKAADPWKNDTGLFFFKGDSGEKFAVCSAGGGFAYVGAMQDSFPHALELSKRGYNAFAVIYRPGAQTACEDLSRVIVFIFDHADELEIDTDCYSLWGGSAGARMSAWVGSYDAEGFGERALPHAGAVIMQYTGFSEYSENDPPTYVCVGDSDGIANWRTMKSRLDNMSALGIDTEFHVYKGLRHGFGIGTGTIAEGWIDDAVKFWEKQF